MDRPGIALDSTPGTPLVDAREKKLKLRLAHERLKRKIYFSFSRSGFEE
jgi:hypothetical protein